MRHLHIFMLKQSRYVFHFKVCMNFKRTGHILRENKVASGFQFKTGKEVTDRHERFQVERQPAKSQGCCKQASAQRKQPQVPQIWNWMGKKWQASGEGAGRATPADISGAGARATTNLCPQQSGDQKDSCLESLQR